MTNKQFMELHAFDNNGKEARHGRLLKDAQGNIFSYGAHYPLLFKVCGLRFVNTRGYSQTTSKHIGIARSLASLRVNLPYNCSRFDFYTVKKALENSLNSLNTVINDIVRHGTQREASLLEAKQGVIKTLDKLNSALMGE